MSVTCVLHAASDAEIDSLLEEPARIHAFLGYTEVEPPGRLMQRFRLQTRRPPPPIRPYFDLGKSWEAVHYVLNGTREDTPLPHGFVTSGGTYIGDEDVGYGSARGLKAAAVQQIADSLQRISPDELQHKVDPRKMQSLQIYGAPFPDDPAGLADFVGEFSGLREFVMDRSVRADGMVIQYV